MEYVKDYLKDRIDYLKANIKWCKESGYNSGAGNYKYQLKQFREALKILNAGCKEGRACEQRRSASD